MAEYRFETAEKAKMVPDLMKEVGGEDYPLHYFIDAAKSYDNMEDAVKFLQQPCPICTMDYPIQDVNTLSCDLWGKIIISHVCGLSHKYFCSTTIRTILKKKPSKDNPAMW